MYKIRYSCFSFPVLFVYYAASTVMICRMYVTQQSYFVGYEHQQPVSVALLIESNINALVISKPSSQTR